jgi:hypothetical protein
VVWVRGAAIRPVPPHAVLAASVLEGIERDLARDDADDDLDAAFHRFEATQPHLASHVGDALAKPLDETALALGYFLSIAIWLAFDRTFGERLRRVDDEAWRATEASLALEEELRASDEKEPFDLDDVVAMEQPSVLAFVHEHIEAALDPATREGEAREAEVDVDDVASVYRAILVLTLALSHAVAPEAGDAKASREILA